MKLVGKNILFKPFEGAEVTEGGLIIPDTAKKLSNKGEIVEVGHLVTKVKKGDVGFRVKDWGEPIEVDGETHFIMNESAILSLV